MASNDHFNREEPVPMNFGRVRGMLFCKNDKILNSNKNRNLRLRKGYG
jgi:hypothetical protein